MSQVKFNILYTMFIYVLIICYLFVYILGVQLCFRRFPVDGLSGKWWSK